MHRSFCVIQGNMFVCVCLIPRVHSSEGHIPFEKSLLLSDRTCVSCNFVVLNMHLGDLWSLRSNQGIPEVETMFLIHEGDI